MASTQDVLHLETRISEATKETDIKKLLRQLRPWPEENIKLEKLTGGIINQMYCCWCEEKTKGDTEKRVEKLVVRIYLDAKSFEWPTEAFNKDNENVSASPTDGAPSFKDGENPFKDEKMEPFDHSIEINNLTKLRGTGLAPELLAVFENGLCYRYVYGNTLNSVTVRSEDMLPHVTKSLAYLHSLPIEPTSSTWGLNDIKNSLYVYPPKFSDIERTNRLLEIFPNKDEILKELKWLEDLIKDVKSPTVFCHNDSKGENFVWDKEEGILSMLDFEHSSNNHQAREIGSHFVVYNDVANSKPGQYPEREFQLRWITMYLRYWYKFTNKNPDEITNKEIETLYVEANKYAQMTRLLIGICCLFLSCQGIFDCYEFCIQLLKDYKLYKPEIETLKVPDD